MGAGIAVSARLGAATEIPVGLVGRVRERRLRDKVPASGAGSSSRPDWWPGRRKRRTFRSQPLAEPVSKPEEEN
jgi:hypothetical protein